jgi:ubiquitin-like protein Pup
MAARERVQKERTKTDQSDDQSETLDVRSSDDLKESLDDVLDEIDAVLEENAEEFVKGYVQKGGE